MIRWATLGLVTITTLVGEARLSAVALPIAVDAQDPAPVQQTPAAPDSAPGKPAPAAKSDKNKAKKEKKPKEMPLSISNGTLTVDGFTGKAALNYDIADLKFIYIYAPGIGTAIVSNEKFGKASEQPNAFDGPNLTVTVDGHQLQISSDKRLLGKRPESAWVYLDHDFALASKFPVVGYGPIPVAPYAWPGAKQAAAPKPTAIVQPPPLPVNLLPVMLAKPCSAATPASAPSATPAATSSATPAKTLPCPASAPPKPATPTAPSPAAPPS